MTQSETHSLLLSNVERAMISPHHTLVEFPLPWKIEDKIEIFRDRVQWFQLGVAKDMLEKSLPNCQLAVLNIVSSYFEMIAKYIDGYIEKNQSPHYFKMGISNIFPDIGSQAEDVLKALYENLRCGLYHAGFPKDVILCHPLPAPVGYQTTINIIAIDPPLFLDRIQAHFNQYIVSLKNPDNIELRKKFEAKFNADNP